MIPGAAYALSKYYYSTIFPFLSLSPGLDLHLPTSGQKTVPQLDSFPPPLHYYDMKLYLDYCVLLLKNLLAYSITSKVFRQYPMYLTDFFSLCHEFQQLYSLREQSLQDCLHFRHQPQVWWCQDHLHLRSAGYKFGGLPQPLSGLIIC